MQGIKPEPSGLQANALTTSLPPPPLAQDENIIQELATANLLIDSR